MNSPYDKYTIPIRKGEPISELGLTFYPVTMEHYERFLMCKDALCLRQSSLPVRYVAMDFTTALFTLEMDALSVPEAEHSGAFYKLLQFLYLSLRLDMQAADLKNNLMCSQSESGIKLEYLLVTQGENTVKLTPRDISAVIRPLIARQNGLELPRENYDNELVAAEAKKRELASANSAELDFNVDNLIETVAYKSGVRRNDVLEWTVLEFECRRRAIERDAKYFIFALAENSGMVKFKKGNPVPSMFFDVRDDTMGSVSAAELNLDKLTQKD